jgi:sugar O-acyltransferase (sialic acid O-acetyltransferase NeuD family)
MKKVIIFGNGDFARRMCYYITTDTDWELCGFTVEAEYLNNATFQGLPLINFDTITDKYPNSEYEIVLGVGYRKMNTIRQRIFLECKQKGYRISQFVHSTSFIQTDNIGEGTIILERVLILPFTSIGVGNLILSGATISHDNSIGDFNLIAAMTSTCGFVTIKNNCFLGNRCMVIDGVTLHDYALVGAGANVKKDMMPYEVMVPARSVTLENKRSTDFI